MKIITQNWYNLKARPPLLFTILSRIYKKVIFSKRSHFLKNQRNLEPIPVPVIVIGNITVGGTGKTPLVIALAQFLLNKGYKVGIISRGYKGKAKKWPIEATGLSKVEMVGDEPLLMAKITGLPVFVGPTRNDNIRALLNKYAETTVILSDDGLQHYAMKRDIEIVVVDGNRMFGNRMLLPAGPLREPISRLRTVDLCVYNGLTTLDEVENKTNHDCIMQIKLGAVHNLTNKLETKTLSEFADKKVHAVAGIGNPKRFFEMLKDQRLILTEHAFKDHHRFEKGDFQFSEKLPVLMTEKDAVKCMNLNLSNCWVVTSKAQIDEKILKKLNSKLVSLGKNNG